MRIRTCRCVRILAQGDHHEQYTSAAPLAFRNRETSRSTAEARGDHVIHIHGDVSVCVCRNRHAVNGSLLRKRRVWESLGLGAPKVTRDNGRDACQVNLSCEVQYASRWPEESDFREDQLTH